MEYVIYLAAAATTTTTVDLLYIWNCQIVLSSLIPDFRLSSSETSAPHVIKHLTFLSSKLLGILLQIPEKFNMIKQH